MSAAAAADVPLPPLRDELPALRDELTLHEALPGTDGAPTWTLFDPLTNRYFSISWPSFEILSRWHLRDPRAVAGSVSQGTPLDVSVDDVTGVAEFLVRQHLCMVFEGSERLARLREQAHPGWLMWLLKTYLFFRIPLIRPQRLLRALYPLTAFAFQPAFWWLIGLAGMLGLYLTARKFDVVVATLPQFMSLEGALWLAGTIVFAKIVHEFAHALTAYRFGCNVATMGVAFLVLWPVLYTDTNDAWKLPSVRQRQLINAAGIAAELALACAALLAWHVLPEGPWRAAAFLLATTTWIMTLAVNLNPFMRFDGYFLMSDALGIENLHERAFAFGRWRLREWLFGLREPPPEEALPARTRTLLVWFAFGVWLYRLVLFIGIALLVYHLFFKLLGIVLMVLELWWFIARPVVREVGEWLSRREQIGMNFALVRSAALLAGALWLLLTPWRTEIEAPALLHAQRYMVVEIPTDGRLARIDVAPGQRVREGDALFEIESPSLAHQIHQARADLDIAKAQLQAQGVDPSLQQLGQVIARQVEQASQALANLERARERLSVRAEIDGLVTEVASDYAVGQWVAAREPIAFIADPTSVSVSAFVYEEDLTHMEAGAPARFYADAPELAPIDCVLNALDNVAAASLDEPYLSGEYGGRLATVRDADGRLVPVRSVYRARMHECAYTGFPGRVVPGVVHVTAQPSSLAGRAWTVAYGVFLRESGF